MTPELQEINQRIKRIEKFLLKQNRDTWVSASWITMVTGWKQEKLRQAREQNIIKYKPSEDKKSYVYLLQSIPEMFIKNKSHETVPSKESGLLHKSIQQE